MPDSEFGSDGQLHDTDKPLSQSVERKPFTSTDPFVASEPGAAGQRMGLLSEPNEDEFSAAERLRLFEDEHLGKDAVRLQGGRVERGSGSLFQRLPPDLRKAHEAIEKTVETEQKVADARVALSVAEGAHNIAVKAADDAQANIQPANPPVPPSAPAPVSTPQKPETVT